MNTPSPNSMKRDPGRGSAYLSFLKKRCRDFFFFCLLLGVYVAFITLTGIGCPIRFSTGISCPGCGMSRAVLLMLSGHFQAAFPLLEPQRRDTTRDSQAPSASQSSRGGPIALGKEKSR